MVFNVKLKDGSIVAVRFRLECGYQPIDVPNWPVPDVPDEPDPTPTPEPKDPADDPQNNPDIIALGHEMTKGNQGNMLVAEPLKKDTRKAHQKLK